MLLGCIADDFTGASDLANTLRQQGMSVGQFVGIPEGPMGHNFQAGVVSLKTRSCPVEEAIQQSLAALAWLRAQGCRQILFKYCSTFDSTPAGNIGPVASALMEALGTTGTIFCPSFPANGRTVYQGHLFVHDRLLNESGMEKHPLTPMTDANIRRWLALQTDNSVGLIPLSVVRSGSMAIRASFEEQTHGGSPFIVVDAISDDDLFAIGEAISEHKLITGGSGVASGLPENFRRLGLLEGQTTQFPGPTQGPGFVLSGSCSVSSRKQVSHYLESHAGISINPVDVMTGTMTADDVISWLSSNLHREPIVYSTADPETVGKAQKLYGVERLAERLDHLFGSVAAGMVAKGVTRIVVGGGETSGAVVQAVGASTLLVGPEIDPGVPVLALDNSPVRLALKSGNFGGTAFYSKAMEILGEANG